jgi:hypothetical protein
MLCYYYYSKAVELSRQKSIIHQESHDASGSTQAADCTQYETIHPEPRKEGFIVSSSATNAPTPSRKTFRDLFPKPQTTAMMSSGPLLYYEDTMKYQVA